jgi:hypothetical protein
VVRDLDDVRSCGTNSARNFPQNAGSVGNVEHQPHETPVPKHYALQHIGQSPAVDIGSAHRDTYCAVMKEERRSGSPQRLKRHRFPELLLIPAAIDKIASGIINCLFPLLTHKSSRNVGHECHLFQNLLPF